jgi:hypothetical protein
MEKDCCKGDSQISCSNGLSVRLDSLGVSQNEILGWDEKQNGLTPSKHTHFIDKGEKECVELVFNDGRKITCTPNHRLLTADNKWIHADEIILGKTEISAGITYPLAHYDDEMKECNGWSLRVGSRIFKTNTHSEYMKTLAFARILGYLLTDGFISRDGSNSAIYLGHSLDAGSIIKDLELLVPMSLKYYMNRNLYSVRIPNILLKDIVELEGMLFGRRVSQQGTWPTFILDDSCPRPIIREFLGGIFGGDGHGCSILKRRGKYDNVTSVAFSQSKYEEHVDSLKTMLEQLQALLKKCGITGTTIQEPKQTTYSKNRQTELGDSNDDSKESTTRPSKCYEITLRINTEELINFHDKIGFRHCCHKAQRLSAAVSYIRLREETIRQRLWLVKRSIELISSATSSLTKPKAIERAVKELEQREVIVHPYAIPASSNVTDYIKSAVKSDVVKLTSKSKTGESDRVFPTAEQFFTDMGVLKWFTEEESAVCYGVNREHCALPTMKLRVVGRRPVGKQRVYDITVDGINNFVANGIVSHNCILSHGAAEFLKETLQDRSDNYRMHTCKSCGLISSVNKEAGIYMCKNCNNTTKFAEVRIPYAMKLFIQELETMSVAPRIVTKED